MLFKITPDGIEKPVGKQMHVKIDDLPGKHRRGILLKLD
jgi:chromosomal replication initiation ATPase DnaA